MTMIRDNILRLQSHITSICKRVGRNPEKITLVGVTKFAGISDIQEAIESGLTHIGENKVQQAKEKFPILDSIGTKVTKHMIGHLQTNKVRQALEIFDLIQSVDSLKLAEEIERQAEKLAKDVDILVQVNTSGEEQKYGIDPSRAEAFVEKISELKHIYIRGLMTMAPFTDHQDIIRRCFKDLRNLFEEIGKKNSVSEKIEMKYLSMGMTADYEIALEEGANMVRIGRAIFQNG